MNSHYLITPSTMEEPIMFSKMKISWNVLLVISCAVASVIISDLAYAAI